MHLYIYVCVYMKKGCNIGATDYPHSCGMSMIINPHIYIYIHINIYIYPPKDGLIALWPSTNG